MNTRTYLMHRIGKDLSCVSGKVISQFGPILVSDGLFNPRDDLVRNEASVGLYIYTRMGW